MSLDEFLLNRRRRCAETPHNVIQLPLRRAAPSLAPALPAIPLDKLGNDALRAIGRDIIAEHMRRGLARQNAWDGPPISLAEIVEWLGGETYDARIELTSRTVGLSVLPITSEAEADAP